MTRLTDEGATVMVQYKDSLFTSTSSDCTTYFVLQYTGSDYDVTFELSDSEDRYPHKCPRCGGAAYVGATEVDCLLKCS